MLTRRALLQLLAGAVTAFRPVRARAVAVPAWPATDPDVPIFYGTISDFGLWDVKVGERYRFFWRDCPYDDHRRVAGEGTVVESQMTFNMADMSLRKARAAGRADIAAHVRTDDGHFVLLVGDAFHVEPLGPFVPDWTRG